MTPSNLSPSGTLLLRPARVWPLAIVWCWIAACDSGANATGPVNITPVTAPAPFVVSSPVHSSLAALSAPVASQSVVSTVVYVSLPPGSIESGVSANISVPRTGAATVAPMIDGGFDPVPVAAAAGDTVVVDVHTSGAPSVVSYKFKVPPVAPPVIVRTDPPPHKRDVPLNPRIIIVFSTPIDGNTLTDTAIVLNQDTVVVRGQLSFADPSHTSVAFTPSTTLVPETDYTLVITQAVHDVNGLSLASASGIGFATGADPSIVMTVDVAPGATSLEAGGTVQLSVTPRSAAGYGITGRPVSWTTSDASVATVASTGVVTGIGVGAAVISATVQGKTGTATVTVIAGVVTLVTVSPNPATISLGRTMALTALARSARGTSLTRTFTWASANPVVASVNSSGLVTAGIPGTTVITAMVNGVTGVSVVAVISGNSNATGTVEVSPTTASVPMGLTVPLSAVAKDVNGKVLTGVQVVWSSSNPDVATVNSAGQVLGVSSGVVAITATVEGNSASASVTVTSNVVASISLSPNPMTLAVAESGYLVPTILSVDGGIITGRTPTWTTSDSAIAKVISAGLVSGVGPGQATITATIDGKSATTTVNVTPNLVASIVVTPTQLTLVVGNTQGLTATLRNAHGALVVRTIAWSSSNPAVASVNANGYVTAVSGGTATIGATADGVTGTAAVTVEANPTLPGSHLYHVSGVVTDDNGAPLANATVWFTFYPGDGGYPSISSAPTGADGAYSASFFAVQNAMNGPPGMHDAVAIAYVEPPGGYDYDFGYVIAPTTTVTRGFSLHHSTQISAGQGTAVTVGPGDPVCTNNWQDMHPWPEEYLCRVVQVVVPAAGTLTISATPTPPGGAAPGVVIDSDFDVVYDATGVATITVSSATVVTVSIEVPWSVPSARSFSVVTSFVPKP